MGWLWVGGGGGGVLHQALLAFWGLVMNGNPDARPSIVVSVVAYVAAQRIVNVEDARFSVQVRASDLFPRWLASRQAIERWVG